MAQICKLVKDISYLNQDIYLSNISSMKKTNFNQGGGNER